MTDTEAFIPVEFIYDLPAPTLDAGLCANARKALRDGRCDPANHPDGDLPGTSSVVCPSASGRCARSSSARWWAPGTTMR